MNSDHIKDLGIALAQIGFTDLERALLKRICFRLNHFQLQRAVQRGGDLLLFNFQFEREASHQHYCLRYYDVSLLKEPELPSKLIGNVDLKELEKKMSVIEWNRLFSDEQTSLPADKTDWETATAIEQICEQLSALSLSEEGQIHAGNLKLKYWSAHLPKEIIDSITSTKSKLAITQRFYYCGENSITVDEAFRFLQNKVIEQETKRKEKIVTSIEHEAVSPIKAGKVKGNPSTKA